MKEEQQVPPGIKAGINKAGAIFGRIVGEKNYASWYKQYFLDGYMVPYTIEVDGKEWNVWDLVRSKKYPHAGLSTIKSFDWIPGIGGGWNVIYTTGGIDNLIAVEKLPHSSLDRSGSQPKTNYERLEEMLDRSDSIFKSGYNPGGSQEDRSVSQPGKPHSHPKGFNAWLAKTDLQKYNEDLWFDMVSNESYNDTQIAEMYIKSQPSQPVGGYDEDESPHGYLHAILGACEGALNHGLSAEMALTRIRNYAEKALKFKTEQL